jgi:hypothetical protein
MTFDLTRTCVHFNSLDSKCFNYKKKNTSPASIQIFYRLKIKIVIVWYKMVEGLGYFFCHKTCPDLENSVQVKIHKESKFCGRNEETNFGK